jgi:uncharacterized surface protein with fasciclin (FAS1) repeats
MKLLAGCALALAFTATAAAVDEQDVAATVLASADHTVFATAIREAGLVEMLKGKGPFTLLAPTDAAFKKLGDDEVRAIIKDKSLLKKIVLAHVIEGQKSSGDLAKFDGQDVKTLGGSFPVTVKDGLRIGGAKLTVTDRDCTNGVLHAIDAVLLTK